MGFYYFTLVCFFVFVTLPLILSFSFFFFNDTATTEIYTLSLHDALPICMLTWVSAEPPHRVLRRSRSSTADDLAHRSEEHTSELQSHLNLVCRLLLEKKKITHCRTEVPHQQKLFY